MTFSSKTAKITNLYASFRLGQVVIIFFLSKLMFHSFVCSRKRYCKKTHPGLKSQFFQSIPFSVGEKPVWLDQPQPFLAQQNLKTIGQANYGCYTSFGLFSNTNPLAYLILFMIFTYQYVHHYIGLEKTKLSQLANFAQLQLNSNLVAQCYINRDQSKGLVDPLNEIFRLTQKNKYLSSKTWVPAHHKIRLILLNLIISFLYNLQQSQRLCYVTVTVPPLGVLNRPTSLTVLKRP